MARESVGEEITPTVKSGRKGKAKAEENGTGQIGQAFTAALQAVRAAPESDDAWAHLEELADSLQRPDEVAQAYRETLDGHLATEVRDRVSRRAVQFFDEWFGDDPDAMDNLLSRILDRDPRADWAFERLVMVHTVSEQWDPLLALYDRMLDATKDLDRRKQLLEDAAQTAKDFAHQPTRAVDYLRLHLELEPSNTKLVSAIERLLERQTRWTDLIDLWRGRLGDQPEAEARAARLRIAKTYLDHLEATEPALRELEVVVQESPGHPEACEQLERVLRWKDADPSIRMQALSLLRSNYEAADRPADVVTAIEHALGFAQRAEMLALHREAGSRLAILGRDADALAHYAELLRREPNDADARRQMRQIAGRSGLHAPHAEALLAAADEAEPGQKSALTLEAAHIYREELSDPDRAIDRYGRVLDLADADRNLARAAAHHLNELLAAAKRSAERLEVLERLADLEDTSVVRRAVLGDAGRLAVQLDDADRALRAYDRRLEADSQDLDALDASIDVLDRYERWAPLVSALARRADTTTVREQRRGDLVRLARLQAEKLGQGDEAIATWLMVRSEFGDESETIAALDELMSGAGRWPELADILSGASSTRRTGAAALLSRLGEVQHTQLGRTREATTAYANTLTVEPADARARKGLRDLLDFEDCAAQAVQALVSAYRRTDDWGELLAILEVRLQTADSARTRVEVLRESADLYERRGEDAKAAQRCIARALVLDPDNPSLEHELLRLSQRTGDWGEAADAFSSAAQAAPSPIRASDLRMIEGRLRLDQLADPGAAVDAFVDAVRHTPESLAVRRAVVEAASAAGRWQAACEAALFVSNAREVVDEMAIRTIESACESAGAWDQMVPALEAAIEGATPLPTIARVLETACATWHRDKRGDMDAAEAAAARAVEHAPHHYETLSLLAELRRRNPGQALAQTLLRLDGLTDRDLDALREAAEVAVNHGTDTNWIRETLIRTFRKSARLFARDEAVIGEQQPDECALWALQRLVELELEADRREQAVRALMDASELPFARDQVLDLRIRAARLSVELGDRDRAIDLLRSVVEERDDDIELVRELAALCEKQQRTLELVTMRRRELELTRDVERRLALRLELSSLTGDLERRGGRVESLRENLSEHPGHRSSVEALKAVLSDKGRYEDLADILTAQAKQLQSSNSHRSAELWADVATLVEERFGDRPRAVDALRAEVALVPSERALDTLARLHLELGDPGEAADVLARRLEMTDKAQRVPVLLRLARAQIQAENPMGAIRTLEVAFGEAPRSGEVRKLLLRLYRQHEMWQPLGRALTTAAQALGDAGTILAYAREAAEIYDTRLNTPDDAVPILERAYELDPSDKHLRSRLAEGLRVAGRLTEARELLLGLVADFGRRRSVERAAVHLQLAQVANAEGDVAEAINQLEQASSMDATNPQILKTLAETARDSDQLERAERAYRTLLLQVKRQGPEAILRGGVGPAQVLLELSAIAQQRGDEEQAEEQVESALEALAQGDVEGRQLQTVLRKREAWSLLRRVLDTRMQHAETPRRRAEILSDLAELHERDGSTLEDALAARLEALRADPGTPSHHERARELASRMGRLQGYIEVVEDLLERARRATDLYVRCELLLRLAEVAEIEQKDPGRATELLEQAEETGVREVDVWRAIARLAAATGDTTRQVSYLERLAALGAAEGETRADALYRMAEVYLAGEDTQQRGLHTLTEAIDSDPRWEHVSRLLQRAVEAGAENPELLALFERAARKTGDERALLLAIERRSSLSDTTPEQVREGVELARKLGNAARSEALMVRAVELAEGLLDGEQRVRWALLGLAALRKEADDMAGSVKWLCEVIDSGDTSEDVLALAREIANSTMEDGGDPTLAVRVYEALAEREPARREVWQPLAGLYRKMGELDRLQRLVEETLDSLDSSDERNALRLELAQTLMDDPNRESDAVEALRNILLESPEHPEAQELMARLLERSGNEEELLELLQQQLMAAQTSGNVEAIVAAALRLGERQAKNDEAQALVTLRAALDTAPDDIRLLRRAFELLPKDDAEAFADIAKRLIAVEEGEAAANLALRLAEQRAEAWDTEGQLEALVAGYKRAPDDPRLRKALEEAYESRGDYRGLADMLASAAQAETDPKRKVILLRQVATTYRDMLSDPDTAARILEEAHSEAPGDVELTLELVSMLASAGRVQKAEMMVSRLLERPDGDDQSRLTLLSTRADLRASMNDVDGTLTDLEAALELDPRSVAPRLIDALERKKAQAAEERDVETERFATMRLVEVLLAQGDRERAREALWDWTEVHRKDVDALRMLRDLDATDERWEAVSKVSARLVAVTSDEAQIEAALTLARACRMMGSPQDARPGLEHARRKQPDSKEIRAELRSIYEEIGANGELAKLLWQETEEVEDPQEQVILLRKIAGLQLSEGASQDAIPVLARLLELAPGDPEATMLLVDAYIGVGAFDEADAILDPIIEEAKGRRSAELAPIFHRKAILAGARGDREAQLDHLQQAFSCDKNNGLVAADLADLAEEMENWEVATRVLRTITLIDGDSPISRPHAFLRQARIAYKKGDAQRAVLWARKAKHEDPQDEEINAFLAELGES